MPEADRPIRLPGTHHSPHGSLLLSDLPPSRRQVRLALWIGGFLVAALLLSIPLARIPLPGTERILPGYATAIVVNDLLTAVLLLALFSAKRSASLLILACGYILVGLLAIPWALTFPGVFADQGLLGAGQQTTAAIAALRRVGFPLFVLAYALLRVGGDPPVGSASWRSWPLILLAVSAVSAFTLASTIVIIRHDQDVPALMAGRMEASGLWTYVADLSTVLYLAAIAVLWARCRSVLDLWLIIVLFTLLIEIVLLSYISLGRRLSAGWWAGRAYGLAAASVVLILMLWETTTLYARLLTSVAAERWARESRLTSLEALSASIAHEVNQPLASMVTNADAGLLWLDRREPDVAEAKAALGRIVGEGHRAGKVIESIRTLFQKDTRDRVPLNLNEVIATALPKIRREAQLDGVDVQVELADELPAVSGNALQLQQVLSNLATNAIEAMATVPKAGRTLHVRTRGSEVDGVLLSVADTGVGLDAREAEGLFEPFVTTKPKGLGMGLMICRSIVEAHGGRISAAGNAPRGSVFTVFLPGVDGSRTA